METQRAVVKSRIGRSTGRRIKQLFFILVFIAITSISSFAATDVLFLVDTTGSMSGLSNFKTAFNGILEAIATNSSCPETIMYGVADYRNYTDGDNYTAYGVNLDQPFTYSTQAVSSAINGLATGDGADLPESQLKAMVSITSNWLTTSGDLGFNGHPGAQRILIWAGDAPGHISGDEDGSSGAPPAGYYPTLDAVIDALTAQGIIVFALNSLDSEHGLNEPYDGIDDNIPPERQQASEITEATGGELFNNVQSATTTIKDAIIDKIICFTFEKDDDLDDEDPADCRQDGQEIVYTISWTNTSGQPLTNAWILDRLPTGVSYPISYTLDPNTWEIISSDPNYDPENHEYVWFIGQIPADASGSVSLTVIVNSNAVPGMNLINIAELYDGESLVTIAPKETLICCPENPLSTIYVDKSATGANSGLNWQNAYNSLDDALTQARESVCVTNFTILVAQGTYAPQNATNGFVLPSGCSVFGGYPTGGGDVASPKKYETILTGLIDEDDIPDVDTIVSMGNNTLLDGFTITKAAEYGVYGSGVDFTIESCTIEKSDNYGIRVVNGDMTLKWCYVKNNKWDGVRHDGAGFVLNVENCWIMKNQQYGINCQNSTPIVKNSIVSESDLSEAGNAGIRLYHPTAMPVLHNVTIAHNKNVGIAFADNGTVSDPNGKDYPDLENCILWLNNNAGAQFTGFSKQHIYHSCIYDPNDPNGVDLTPDVNYNFSADPKFAYVDPNNVHITYASPCKDTGNPLMSYDNQVDMDNRGRVLGTAVDIGAYEIDCSDVSNPLDWNADGRINMFEFNYFSRAWLTYDPNNPLCDPNNPNYVGDPNAPGYISELDKERFNSACDLDSDLDVDLGDLMIFVEDTPWLWRACWMTEDYLSEMLAGGEQQQVLAFNSFEQIPVLGSEAQIPAVNADVIGTQEVLVVSEPNERPELSAEEQIAQLQDAIEFLEQIWQGDPNMQQEIGADEWLQFIEAVSQSLSELQTESVQIE